MEQEECGWCEDDEQAGKQELILCDGGCGHYTCLKCARKCPRCNYQTCPNCTGYCLRCGNPADCGEDECTTLCTQCNRRICGECSITCTSCNKHHSCKDDPVCNRKCGSCNKQACANCIPSQCAICDEYLCSACDGAECDEHPVCDYCKLTCESCWRTLCRVCEALCVDVFCDKVDKAFCDLHSNEKCEHVTAA